MLKNICLLFTLALFTSSVFGNDKCDIPYESTKYTDDLKVRLAILRSINETEWEKHERDSKTRTDYFGWGNDISADNDYKKFDEARKEILSNYEYDQDVETARNYVKKSLIGNGLQAYIACLTSGEGVHLFVTKATDKSITLKLNVNLPREVQNVKLQLGQVINVPKDVQKYIKERLSSISLGSEIPIVLPRNKFKEIAIGIDSVQFGNNEGFTGGALVVIPAEPTIKKPSFTKPIGTVLMTTKWWKVPKTQIGDKHCDQPLSGYHMFMWDSTAQLAYCQKIGKQMTAEEDYFLDMRAIKGWDNKNKCREFAQGYTNYSWNGSLQVQLCAKRVDFETMKKLGRVRYVKKFIQTSNKNCPSGSEFQADMRAGLKLCAAFGLFEAD